MEGVRASSWIAKGEICRGGSPGAAKWRGQVARPEACAAALLPPK